MNDFPSLWTDAAFLTAAIASLVPGRMAAATQTASPAAAVFQHRGYYLCFMRMPTFGLKVWREIRMQWPKTAETRSLCGSRWARFDPENIRFTCQWHQCGSRYFDHEFAFVREISNEVWYCAPMLLSWCTHHFSGATLRFAFAEATAAKQPFDPRWTLFFTPHSAALEPDLIARAKSAWWWNAGPCRFDIPNLQAGARNGSPTNGLRIPSACSRGRPPRRASVFVLRRRPSSRRLRDLAQSERLRYPFFRRVPNRMSDHPLALLRRAARPAFAQLRTPVWGGPWRYPPQ